MGWHCGLALQRNGNAFIREESDCQGKIGVDLQSEELLATDSEIHTHTRTEHLDAVEAVLSSQSPGTDWC